MKTYNKIITVEVSVDAIANQLLNTFNVEFPHREMLTEAITENFHEEINYQDYHWEERWIVIEELHPNFWRM